MRLAIFAASCLLASGCSSTSFYDSDGNRMSGFPFVWVDASGGKQVGYVKTSTGFGKASFALDREESGGYTKFANNLDSTAAAQLTGNLLDRAFEAGRTAAALEMKERILRVQDDAVRNRLLNSLGLQ